VTNQTKRSGVTPWRDQTNFSRLLYLLLIMIYCGSALHGQTLSCDWYDETYQKNVINDMIFGPSEQRLATIRTATRKIEFSKKQLSNVCDESKYLHFIIEWGNGADLGESISVGDEMEITLEFYPTSYTFHAFDNMELLSGYPEVLSTTQHRYKFRYIVPSNPDCNWLNTGFRISSFVMKMNQEAASSLNRVYLQVENIDTNLSGSYNDRIHDLITAFGNVQIVSYYTISGPVDKTNLLIPSGANLNYVYIESGQLTVDQNWEQLNNSLWNENDKRSIVMGDGASILLKSGKKLDMDNVIVSTCMDNTDDRWDKIELESGAILEATSSTFNQANVCLDINPSTTVTLIDNNFINSSTGIHLKADGILMNRCGFFDNSIGLNLFAENLFLDKCDFIGNSFGGLIVNSGGYNAIAKECEFNNNLYGIVSSSGSKLRLEENKFQANENSGVYLLGQMEMEKFDANLFVANDMGVRIATGAGLNLSPSSNDILKKNSFNNNQFGVKTDGICRGCIVHRNNFVVSDPPFDNTYGIFGHNSSFSIMGNDMNGVDNGVFLRRDRATTVKSNDIKNAKVGVEIDVSNQVFGISDLSHNTISASFNGVYAAFNHSDITNNEITINAPDVLMGYGGVSLFSPFRNQIMSNLIEGNKMYGGILINSAENETDIFSNPIILEGGVESAGIRVLGSSNVKIEENSMVGLAALNGLSAYGMYTNNSTGIDVICNYIDNIFFNIGLTNSSSSIRLLTNDLNEYQRGVYIAGSVISEQNHHGNLFNKQEGIGVYSDETNPALVEQSRFIVDGAENSAFLPDLYHPEDIVEDQSTSDDTEQCDPMFVHTSFHAWFESNVCGMIASFAAMHAGGMNTNRINLYREYLRRTILRFLGDDENNWPQCVKDFMNSLTQDEEDREDVIKRFDDYWVVNDSIQSGIISSFQSAAENYYDYIVSEDSTQAAYWLGEAIAYADQIDTISAYESTAEDILDAIYTLASQLNTVDSMSLLYSTVWQAMSNYMKYGELSTTEVSDLEDIAELCSFIYGDVVWKARGMVSRGQSPFDDMDCSAVIPREREAEVQKDMDWQIIPNPASDFIMINQGGRYEILDINGSMMMQRTIDEYGRIELTELPNGVYFIKNASDQTVLKLIKIQ
jgi:hypothetical protein